MTNKEAIANLNMISVAFVEPVTKEQRKLIDDTFDMAIQALEQNQQAEEWYKVFVEKFESCEDAVSRQAVETLVDELARAISDERCCISRGRSTATIMQDILDLPSVNPQEPKTGHWIAEPNCYYRCSLCKSHYVSMCDTIEHHYCPNCGCRMESEG